MSLIAGTREGNNEGTGNGLNKACIIKTFKVFYFIFKRLSWREEVRQKQRENCNFLKSNKLF